ncbi:MAG: hypothetical protein HC828_09910 [Blastochloris sp.]|nr:hypothetical protein [Blastochloris sp.]
MSDGISRDHQRMVIERQIMDWRMARYDLEVQIRVQRRIGGDPTLIDGLVTRLMQCEKALDALDDELMSLDNVR